MRGDMSLRIALLLSVVLLAPLAASHPVPGGDIVKNGGFETGFASWNIGGTGLLTGPRLVTPGANDSGRAMQVVEVGSGSAYLYQDLPVPATTQPAGLTAVALPRTLEFDARFDPGQDAVMGQAIAVVASHNPATGQAETTVAVGILPDNVGTLTAYCNSFLVACAPVTFRLPVDGLWHHYTVEVFRGSATLSIDGNGVASASGSPASVSTPTRILFGDVAFHVKGPAPTVTWDDVRFSDGSEVALKVPGLG